MALTLTIHSRFVYMPFGLYIFLKVWRIPRVTWLKVFVRMLA